MKSRVNDHRVDFRMGVAFDGYLHDHPDGTLIPTLFVGGRYCSFTVMEAALTCAKRRVSHVKMNQGGVQKKRYALVGTVSQLRTLTLPSPGAVEDESNKDREIYFKLGCRHTSSAEVGGADRSLGM